MKASALALPATRRTWLPRQAWPLLLCLLALVALAWLALYRLTVQMQAPDSLMAMAMAGMPMPWTWMDALLMFSMWLLMMLGMMLPSALPMLLLYQQVARRRFSARRGQLAVLLFALAYVLLWSLFSLLATLLQWVLDRQALLDPQVRSSSLWLAAGLLLAAGVYQWLPLKQACLQHCGSPLRFILGAWQSGLRGSWRMGLAHGAYCLGCCWALMGLLFVGGAMNLLWAALLGAFVLLEKLLPQRRWLTRLSGLLLIGAGLLVFSQALPGPGSG